MSFFHCSLSLTQKKPERGFATTSTIKKKEPEVEVAVENESDSTSVSGASSFNLPQGASASGAALGKESSLSNGQPLRGTTNSCTAAAAASAIGDWDATHERTALEASQALAERVKAASEKEASKQLKIYEYDRRVAKEYPEFVWDDPTGIVGQCLTFFLSFEIRLR